ncbi:MAG: c-type cytochrome [Devosia marina]|uniref:cytochrome c oxidase subunit II n=1 Tax=Devosia marina TaxID=2683198 RepID=UPI0032EF0BF1
MNLLLRTSMIGATGILLGACSTSQSALAPTGEQAERINTLFWVMTIGGGLILLLVCILAGIAIFGGSDWRRRLAGENLIKWLGIAFPVVVLSVLLTYGFLVLRAGATSTQDGAENLRISVSGELWWWRVTYTDADGNRIETANEIHLPVGQPVTLELTTADVIHSFWAPNLAGKLDMIPGRTNELTVTAKVPGVTRGQCAEYCGGAHAFMSFHVVAQSPEDFTTWLAEEASPSSEPADAALTRGKDLFLGTGCGGCHAVRGTAATGSIGPDLTHVGSRRSLAAATLPNTAEAIADFIVNNQHIKPENKMPTYAMFSETQLRDLSAYLESLR